MAGKNNTLSLIKKHMLSPELVAEIDKKADSTEYRSNAVKISMDDLDDNIKNKLNNQGDPNSETAYDDNELRNRIKLIEEQYISKDRAFDIVADKIDKSMLNTELVEAIELTAEVNQKADKTYCDETFLKNNTKIEETQLDELLKEKINNAIIKINNMSIIAGDYTDIGETLENIKKDLSTISSSKISKETADNLYRNKTISITIDDVSSDMQKNINAIPVIQKDILNKANTEYVDKNFRKNNTKISIDDFDTQTANDIKFCINASNNMTEAAKTVVSEYYQETIRPELNNSYGTTGSYGHDLPDINEDTNKKIEVLTTYIYPYAFAKAITDFAGTTSLSEGDPNSGKITFSSALNLLWNLYASINNEMSEIKTATGNIVGIKRDIESLKSRTEEIETKLITITDDITAMKEDIAALKATGGK